MDKILKNKKIMIAIIVLIVLAIALYFVIKKRNNDDEEGGNSSSGDGSASGSASLPVASFPLQPYSHVGEYSAAKGSYGQQIAELQTICSKKGHKLQIDGKYGPKSEEAFMSCFGSPFGLVYDKPMYDGLILRYGYVQLIPEK